MTAPPLPTVVQDRAWSDWLDLFPSIAVHDGARLDSMHDLVMHHLHATPDIALLTRREARDLAEDLMLLYEDVQALQLADADGAVLDLTLAGISQVGAILFPAAAIPLAVPPVAAASWSILRRRQQKRRNMLIESMLATVRELSRRLRR